MTEENIRNMNTTALAFLGDAVYEVYVRNYNAIMEYDECKIERYRVRHKELNDEEMIYQNI